MDNIYYLYLYLLPGIRKDRRGGRILKHKRQREEHDTRNIGTVAEARSPNLWPSPLMIKHSKKNSPALSLSADQMVSALLEAEPPIVYSEYDPNRPFNEASMMTLLTNLADRELVHMINWAKRVPGKNAGKIYLNNYSYCSTFPNILPHIETYLLYCLINDIISIMMQIT